MAKRRSSTVPVRPGRLAAAKHVNRETEDAEVEDEGGERMPSDDVAEAPVADGDVAGLEGHAEGEREIGEVGIARRLVTRKIETAVGRRIMQMGIMERIDRVGEQPGDRQRAD